MRNYPKRVRTPVQNLFLSNPDKVIEHLQVDRAIWPDWPEGVTDANRHAVISRVRAELPQGYVLRSVRNVGYVMEKV